jgi:hypothetical protein
MAHGIRMPPELQDKKNLDLIVCMISFCDSIFMISLQRRKLLSQNGFQASRMLMYPSYNLYIYEIVGCEVARVNPNATKP